MALLHIEGFDDLTVSDIARAGYGVVDDSATLSIASGRYGGSSLQNSTSISSGLVERIGIKLPISFSGHLIAGVAAYLIPQPKAVADLSQYILYFETGGGTPIYLRYRVDSQKLTLGSLSVVINIPQLSWHYFEVDYDPSSQQWLVYLNDVLVLSGTYDPGGAITLAGIGFAQAGGSISSARIRWDDWYILDSSGTLNNTRLGDCKVVTRYPTSDTAAADFTPNTGVDHYALVDEVNQDGDGTYNEGTNPGDKDRYSSVDSIGNPLTVHGVGVRSFARKTDAGTREIRNIIRSGATTSNGDTIGLASTYTAKLDVYDANPNGGIPWTKTSAEAAEFGVEIVT